MSQESKYTLSHAHSYKLVHLKKKKKTLQTKAASCKDKDHNSDKLNRLNMTNNKSAVTSHESWSRCR